MKKSIFYILGLTQLLAGSLSLADTSSASFYRPLHKGYPGKVSQFEVLNQIKAGTELLQSGFKTPTSCTAPTIDPEIKRASAGEKMIRSAIDFCSAIRAQGNPELPMPAEFKTALKDSLTKAKKALSEPKTLAVLSRLVRIFDLYRNQRRSERPPLTEVRGFPSECNVLHRS